MVLKHDITPKLGPVLKALRRKYSPVRSKSSILLLLLLIDIYFLDKNQRVFLYEDDAWTIKGRYKTALMKMLLGSVRMNKIFCIFLS